MNNTTTTLDVSFGTVSTSTLFIGAVDLRTNTAGGLGVKSAANFSVTSVVEAAFTQLDKAITTLRVIASSLGSNVALLQVRLDFTKAYVNDLEEGASKLNLADINEEGAILVSLQTRQQLGI